MKLQQYKSDFEQKTKYTANTKNVYKILKKHNSTDYARLRLTGYDARSKYWWQIALDSIDYLYYHTDTKF